VKTPGNYKHLTLRGLGPIAFITAGTLLNALPILAQQPFTTTVPGDILDQFHNAKQIWTTNVWVYANNLFALLALVEFAWSAAVMLLEKTDLQSWTAALVRKMMWLGAFYMLLLKGNQWIPWIIASFTQIGSNAAGFNGNSLSPGDVFAQGLAIAGGLMDSASTSAFFTNPGSSLALALGSLLILLSYTVITIQYVVTVVESYMALSVGFVFLGFGGSRWTATYVERYLGLAISIGIKMMLLYMLISAGMNLGVGWMSEAQGIGTSAHPALTAFDVIGAALIFMMLCWQIPKLFAAVLGGAPALTGGDLVSTTTGFVATAAGLGSVTAGGAALATRAAAALGGVSPAAAAGGTGSVGASVAAVGVSGRNSGGAAGGGTVPPPSSPFSGPPSNGRPRQPDPPPFTRGSGGASSELTGGTRAGSSPQQRSSGASNGSGNGRVENSARSVLSAIGGENLAGSGFENERPASGFTVVSAPLTTNRGVAPPPMSSGTAPNSDTSGEKAPPPRVTGFSGHNGGSGPSPDRGGQNNNPRPEAQSSRSAKFEADPVPDPRTAGQQSPTQNGRENPPSRARNADQALSGAANRLRGIRNQLGGLPSDAAPHATPPRMPIDHHE
jgi:type IV secretion system protein TrbL